MNLTFPDVLAWASGTDLANQLASRFLALKTNGNKALTNEGDWDNGTNYYTNDYVNYNGVDYRAVADSLNVTPGTDATKWKAPGSGVNPPQRTVITNTSMTQADGRVVMDSASTPRTITLPDAAASYNRRFVLMNVGAAALTVQVLGGTDKIINGASSASDLTSVTVNRGESFEALGIKRADGTYAFYRS